MSDGITKEAISTQLTVVSLRIELTFQTKTSDWITTFWNFLVNVVVTASLTGSACAVSDQRVTIVIDGTLLTAVT